MVCFNRDVVTKVGLHFPDRQTGGVVQQCSSGHSSCQGLVAFLQCLLTCPEHKCRMYQSVSIPTPHPPLQTTQGILTPHPGNYDNNVLPVAEGVTLTGISRPWSRCEFRYSPLDKDYIVGHQFDELFICMHHLFWWQAANHKLQNVVMVTIIQAIGGILVRYSYLGWHGDETATDQLPNHHRVHFDGKQLPLD